MFKVEIKSLQVETRSGEKNGKPWKMRMQPDCFIQINGEIRRLPITLQDDEPAFQVGVYQFDVEKLVEVGRYGLEINRFKALGLIAVTQVVKAA